MAKGRIHKYIIAKEAARLDASTKVTCPVCGKLMEQGMLRELFWCDCQKIVEDRFFGAHPDAWRDDVWGKLIAVGFIGDTAVGEMTAIRAVGGHDTSIKINFVADTPKAEMEAAEWELVDWM